MLPGKSKNLIYERTLEKFINKIINRSSVLLFSNILGLLGKSRNSRDPETLLSSKFPSCKI
nr:MAG TPA: hypothetical protein [Bacteriophage sp.]